MVVPTIIPNDKNGREWPLAFPCHLLYIFYKITQVEKWRVKTPVFAKYAVVSMSVTILVQDAD